MKICHLKAQNWHLLIGINVIHYNLKFNKILILFYFILKGIFGCLPFHFCVRIVDCFLVEGEKFLYRIALALIKLYDKHQKTEISLVKMRKFCEDISEILTPSQLINKALKIQMFSKKGT